MSHEDVVINLYASTAPQRTISIVTTDAEGAVSAYDLTGATVKFYAKTDPDAADGDASFTYSSAGGTPRITVLSPATDGKVRIDFQSADLTKGSYFFRLDVEKGSVKEPVLAGLLIVHKWTFTYRDPATINKDAVRLLVGDTDSERPLLSDEEIEYFLVKFPGVYPAAVEAAEAIAAKFAREVTKSIGGASISASEKMRHYKELAASLRTRATKQMAVTPYAGGMKRSDKEIDEADTDLIDPYFRVGMHDEPGNRSPH